MMDTLDGAEILALLFLGMIALSLAASWLATLWLQAHYGEKLPDAPIEWCGQIVPAGEFAPRDPDAREEVALVVRALPPETLIEIGPTVFTAGEVEQLAGVRCDREWW